MTEISPAIETAAAAVVAAQQAVADANETLTAARAARDRFANRVPALEGERNAIQARRREGKGDDADDGARLALIAADLSDLAAMLAEADSAVRPAQAAADHAKRTLERAEQELDSRGQDALLARLCERADQLAALLADAVARIGEHQTRRATSRPLWVPPTSLASTIRRLDLMRV